MTASLLCMYIYIEFAPNKGLMSLPMPATPTEVWWWRVFGGGELAIYYSAECVVGMVYGVISVIYWISLL